jgi:hypothetical protein
MPWPESRRHYAYLTFYGLPLHAKDAVFVLVVVDLAI